MIERKAIALKVMLLAYGLTLLPCAAEQPQVRNETVKLYSNDDVSQSFGREGHHMSPITTAELERIVDLKTKFSDSTAPKMTELHALSRHLQLLMAKSTIERTAIFQVQTKINAIHSELALSKLAFELDMIDAMPADAREKAQKRRLFNAAFGGPCDGLSGPPPGFGPPPTCDPPSGLCPPSGFPPSVDPGAMMGPSPAGAPPPFEFE